MASLWLEIAGSVAGVARSKRFIFRKSFSSWAGEAVVPSLPLPALRQDVVPPGLVAEYFTADAATEGILGESDMAEAHGDTCLVNKNNFATKKKGEQTYINTHTHGGKKLTAVAGGSPLGACRGCFVTFTLAI